jgi:hypothetical protein
VTAEAVLDPVRPVPGRYTLLQAVTTVVENDPQWAAGLGFTFQPTSCPGTNDGSVVPMGCEGTTASVTPGDRVSAVDGSPFMVVTTDKCSTFGFEAQDYETRARDLLDIEQSFLIARELWEGTVTGATSAITTPKNRALADTGSTTVTTAPVSPDTALGAVEQSLAVCGMNRRGLIHVRPQLMTALAQNNVIRREGGLWLTPLDNVIVSDGGYLGSAPGTPDTDPTTSQWIYGTSWMEIHLGPILTFGGLNATGVSRTINDVLTWAYRPVLIQWDQCCHFAAEVDTDALGSNP